MTREEKMTPEEAIAEISYLKVAVNKVVEQALDMAIQALSQEPIPLNDINNALEASFRNGVRSAKVEQEPCDDAISREELLKAIDTWDKFGVDDTNSLFRLDNLSLPHYVPYIHYDDVIKCIKGMPPVTQKSGKCKNCKYFEYDSVAKVDGIPLIVAHEICNKWGDGCKTSEDGYCYLFEPQESEDEE